MTREVADAAADLHDPPAQFSTGHSSLPGKIALRRSHQFLIAQRIFRGGANNPTRHQSAGLPFAHSIIRCNPVAKSIRDRHPISFCISSGEPIQLSVSQERRSMLDHTGSTEMPINLRAVSTTVAKSVCTPLHRL